MNYKRQTKVSFSIQNTMKFFMQYIAFFLVVVAFCCSATDCTPKIAIFSTNSAVNGPTYCPIAHDCKAWLAAGVRKSGIYPIKPDKGPAFQVYCDMHTDGGGWTVFQRRKDGTLDFYRNWVDYEKGFGSLDRNFWLGLKNINRLTTSDDNTLRVDLMDFSGNRAFAKYSQFQVLNAHIQYALIVQKYSGNAGDSLSYSNTMKFSTRDKDNDRGSSNCAQGYKGAWWFNHCFNCHLNGAYYTSPTSAPTWHGINWAKWKGSKYSLKFSEMKVRRN